MLILSFVEKILIVNRLMLHDYCRIKDMDKIVIIDDDKDLLQMVRSLLLKKGFNVSIFSDSLKAINNIRNYRPQLILLDVFLENFDGFEICKKLKASYFTRHIPILMFSGFAKVADTAIYEYGASDFISKPFKANDLVKKVQNLLLNR